MEAPQKGWQPAGTFVAIRVHVRWLVAGQGLPKSRAGSAQALLSHASIWGSSVLLWVWCFEGGFFFSPLFFFAWQDRVFQHLRLRV